MIAWLHPPKAERDIIGGRGLRSVTPWIIAAMTFAILLVAAAGLSIAHAGRTLEQAIAHRFTIVIPGEARANVAGIATRLSKVPGVRRVDAVSEADMRRTLAQWLGPAAQSGQLPVPAMIDFDIADGADPGRIQSAAQRLAPEGKIAAQGGRVAPLLNALSIIQWVTLALVLLLAAAASAAVVMAARGALDSHRATVGILHGIGATDTQVAHLFQRRIALDTLAGSAAGAVAAGAVLIVLASGVRWLGQFGGIALAASDLVLLALIPGVLAVVATLAARRAIFASLGEEL